MRKLILTGIILTLSVTKLIWSSGEIQLTKNNALSEIKTGGQK